MRLLLDESVPVDATPLLREAGHEVATVVGQNLDGYGDDALLAACRRGGWTLLTLDAGHARPEARWAGDRLPIDPRILVLDVTPAHPSAVLITLRHLLPHLARPNPPSGVWVVSRDGTETVDVRFAEQERTEDRG
jgi:predicted nuclease of predicted toxin-antitoxin system